MEARIPERKVARNRRQPARPGVCFVALGSLDRGPVTTKVSRLYDRRVEENKR